MSAEARQAAELDHRLRWENKDKVDNVLGSSQRARQDAELEDFMDGQPQPSGSGVTSLESMLLGDAAAHHAQGAVIDERQRYKTMQKLAKVRRGGSIKLEGPSTRDVLLMFTLLKPGFVVVAFLRRGPLHR